MVQLGIDLGELFYNVGREDALRRLDACCQSAAILWSVQQGPTGSRPEVAHQLNETKCRGSERKAEERTVRTSHLTICLQDRQGRPLQQWPVSRHFRCDASCSTVPDLWSDKEGPPLRDLPTGSMWFCKQAVRQCARTHVVTVVLSITNCCYGCYFCTDLGCYDDFVAWCID